MILSRELAHAARRLLHSPGHALVVLATLAVGAGSSAAVFAVVREALLRPLPFRDPDRLVRVWDRAADGGDSPMSPPVWHALRARTDVFEAVGGSDDAMYTLTGHGDPESIIAYRLSADFFPMLGRPPLLGRVFAPGEDRPGADRVVVLSHRLWMRRLGGDPAVVGRPLTLSGQVYTVIGVMPSGFVHPTSVELWTPFDLPEGSRDDPRARFVRVVARLREGRTLDDARRAVAEVQARLSRDVPEALRGGLVVRPLDDDVRGDARAPLLALGGAVAFVLLGVTANLAGLALARAATHRRDLAVRVALGAGRGRLLRESVAEWGILAAVGGGLALVTASWLARALPGLFPSTISNLALPRVEVVPVDVPVAAFALAAAFAASLAAALVPAVHAVTIDAGEALKGEGRSVVGGRGRVLKALVAAEVAVALVLLVGAGLLVRTFLHLRSGGLGFDPDRVLTARLILPERYTDPSHPNRTLDFHDAVLARVRALPGVEAAGSVAFLPLSGWYGPRPLRLEGEPEPEPGKEREVDVQWIGAGYRDTMRIPLLAGRDVEERDREGTPPVVLVNAAFVRRFLSADVTAALGRRVIYTLGPPGRQPTWREIVGVVGDVRHLVFEHPADPAVFVPFAQQPVPLISLVVRTAGDPRALAPSLQRAVWAEDPEQPVAYLMPFSDLAGESLALRRLSALLALAFALVALGLASLGAYGVVAQIVGSGTREIGVRLALGASASRVVRGVLRDALSAAALGAVLGLALAAGAARLLRSLLVGVSPLDPLALLGAALALVGAAGLAAWLPARRAALVDPAAVLRQE